MPPHLLVALSAHGFGHIGQTAPVVQALRRRLPKLQITVRSAAPNFKVVERFGGNVEHQSATLDVAVVQANALEVKLAETAEAYQAFHQFWSAKVAAEAEALDSLRPDLVLANVPSTLR